MAKIQLENDGMIDRATVMRIKETANIVEVVSEFVTLRKSGANFKGLCPFHNEKTPSFIVSPARGTCHCFGCGKGGNAVTFIMEHEQLSYPEALRWLAAKYSIEIRERDLTDKERQEQSEREAMFIVNEWAAAYFERLLHDDPDGIAAGMAYCRNRGFRDDTIAKYRLGFSLRDRHALAAQAKREGYNEELFVKTGLCYRTDRGELIDRFADRLVFPWIGLSGKVTGFSARLLDARTKGVTQKYVNSPDSDIYHKEKELYGIFQAKKSIAREDRVYIVEGQTDVIAMSQCGIENAVANSGTALSVHQINILHRFTDNVTLLYDGDEAGIHAALRGTDMLLAEGMHVKVLLLPGGEDPDSFARKNTADSFRDYVERNQLDFIQFKTKFLLSRTADPQQRTEAIDSIIRSISVVPNQVLRDTYLHDASSAVGIKEATLINRMNAFVRERKQGPAPAAVKAPPPVAENAGHSAEIERMIAQLVVRNGEQIVVRDAPDDDGRRSDITLAQYIAGNLSADNLRLANPVFQSIVEEAAERSGKADFVAEPFFVNHENIDIALAAARLVEDRYAHIRQDSDTPANASADDIVSRFLNRAKHLVLDFRMDHIDTKLKAIKEDLRDTTMSKEKRRKLTLEFTQYLKMRNSLARLIGQNVM